MQNCRDVRNASARVERIFVFLYPLQTSDTTGTGERSVKPRSLCASSPLCYKQLGRGRGTSKHNCIVSYLLCWRHVSANVGHLQVTKMYIEEKYTGYYHSIGAYSKRSTRSRCRLDYTYLAKSISSQYVQSNRQRVLVESLEYAPILWSYSV